MIFFVGVVMIKVFVYSNRMLIKIYWFLKIIRNVRKGRLKERNISMVILGLLIILK